MPGNARRSWIACAGRPLRPGAPAPGRPFQRGRGFDLFLDAFVFSASLLRDRRDVEEARNLPDLEVPNELDPHHPASKAARAARG